jgi:hypothetical protein
MALAARNYFLFVLPYLNVTANSSLEEFEREVLTHPVFLLQLMQENLCKHSFTTSFVVAVSSAEA